MTQTSDPFALSGGDQPTSPGQEQGKTTQVAQSAKESGAEVAQTAAEQAKAVTAEAGQELRDLMGQARQQLREQAGGQQQKVVGGLRSLVDELRAMADNSDQSGPATQLVRQASHVVGQTADWLEQREAGDLLEEARKLGRRKPGAFLAGAALAGVVAGRLTRGIAAASSDDGGGGAHRGSGTNRGSGDRAGDDLAERGLSATPTTPIPAAQPYVAVPPATVYPPEPVVDPAYRPVTGDVPGRGAGDPGVTP
jgi:hypothetical protein